MSNTPMASSSALRKTPVHKLYSSGLGQQLQSDSPTKGPPVLPQLPQGFHHLYTHIEYECASPLYQHSGSARRTCLKTGKWSGRHVSCSPGEGSRGSLVVWPLAVNATLSQNWHTVYYSGLQQHIKDDYVDKKLLYDPSDMVSLQIFD